ncbi:MAG: MBL fold metallo-hydrolase [Candidatus Bathyarchaeia archaeon]|jgi:L-ascorbate metabolism protein UlaG (beta-lactamase superfamily)
MFRPSKAEGIGKFFALGLSENQIAVMYLGASGILARTSKQSILIDPAGFLKDDEAAALKEVNVLLFTHSHMDHFSESKTLKLVKTTEAPVLAEAKVANKLKGRIPGDKLTSAISGQTYAYGDLIVKAVQGVHKGPIMLFQIKMGDLLVFHAGDSGYVPVKDYQSQLAFLPTGRWSPTASPENAFKMASELKPNVVVVMHGSKGQHKDFEGMIKEKMPQTKVLIIPPYASQILEPQEKATGP